MKQDVKKCPCCRRFLQVLIGTTFNRNRSTVVVDGLQIYCRECDERRKASQPEYGWSCFARVLEREGALRGWSYEQYLALVATDECWWCGAHLSDWGKGHNIDRISSSRGHFELACERLRAEEQHSTLQDARAGQLPLLGGVR